ncbi:MAG: tRNA-dihydrouridine synthase family protein [Planctomycetota bacterium]|nr:MAG: tRNA-dihydrouridine synthase family protein [Planctomycetota bacterium]
MRRIARRFGARYALAEVLIDRFVIEAQSESWVRQHLRIADDDHPIGGQLMGTNPAQFQFAATRLVQAGFDVIDINFGCPVKSAIGGCRGGYHLGQPEAALEIVARVREVVPAAIPVTVKMRRGIDDTEISRERCFRILEGAFDRGVAAVTLHGRTVEQKYVGESRWSFLREAKTQFPQKMILGSGDLYTAEDGIRMLRETGVDGLSMARGAIGNPWIFQQLERLLEGTPTHQAPRLQEQREVIRTHMSLSVEQHGSAVAAVKMRKHLVKYAKMHPQHPTVRNAFAVAKSLLEIEAVISQFYTQDLPGRWPGHDEGLTCEAE